MNFRVVGVKLKILLGAGQTADISNQLLWAVRGELYPSWPVKVVGAEFGWADGDKGRYSSY